jgi:hypothetical protein
VIEESPAAESAQDEARCHKFSCEHRNKNMQKVGGCLYFILWCCREWQERSRGFFSRCVIVNEAAPLSINGYRGLRWQLIASGSDAKTTFEIPSPSLLSVVT